MSKIKTPKMQTANNLVAKHARKFNVAAVHVDRKAKNKKGQTRKMKHKNQSINF